MTTVAARKHCQAFFPWHKNEYRHGSPGLRTAADVHHGRARAIAGCPRRRYDHRLPQPSERFVRKPPAPPPRLPGDLLDHPARKKEPTSSNKHPTPPHSG